jgi:hypothetical protein
MAEYPTIFNESPHIKVIYFSVILCVDIYSGLSRQNLCINRRYLYRFYITTRFRLYFWLSSANIYIFTLTFFCYSPRPPKLANVYIWGRSCVLYTVSNSSYRRKIYKYKIYENLMNMKCIKTYKNLKTFIICVHNTNTFKIPLPDLTF